MTRTLLLVLLFVAGMAALPWLVRRMQQRHGRVGAASASAPRILSAIAVGPHQRVVTVELGGEGERTTLVLGVTPQSIRCLHTQVAQAAPTAGGFSLAMAQATRGDGAAPAPAVAGRPEDAAHG
ncbi:MAG: hypothetical protein ABS38_05455 [Acidovorax sp. SCN 68-22]|jgi:flagellar protein FliO/FliZ|nr:MAG: hypothetical protein ABS38_05455 [Acidovorax sp. SCN 68-22]